VLSEAVRFGSARRSCRLHGRSSIGEDECLLRLRDLGHGGLRDRLPGLQQERQRLTLERRPVEDERALRGRDGLESLKQRRFARIVRADDQAHPRQPVDPQLLEAEEVFDLERGDRGH